MGVSTAAIVGAAVVSAGSAYMAGEQAKKGARAQKDAANAMLATFQGVPIPSIEDQKIILKSPELVGQYSPEQIQAMQMNVSAMEDVKADSQAVDSQKDALAQLSEIADGGMTEGDKAAAREVNREVNQQSVARRNAILNQMASRGVLGSGMELAAQLQGEQQSIDQASRAGDSLIQQAQARALQALGQQSSAASQLRSQSFGEQSDVARARDAINQFNTQNSQNVATMNTQNRNDAQQYNLNQRQNIENQRAALANQQEQYNKGLLQTQFANRMGQASQVANAQAQIGAANQAAANANAAQIQGIGSSVANAMGSYGAMSNANNQAALNRAAAVKQPAKINTISSQMMPANNYVYDPTKLQS